jgi:hypothetical protein
MKKLTLIVLIVMLRASMAFAQQETETGEGEKSRQGIFEGFIGPTYNWVKQDGSTRPAEYEFPKSSIGGNMHIEYAPLPHRFSIETHYLNQKDYFGDMDYAYRDIVMLNILTRGMYHNLDHFSFGADDPATPSPSFTDQNPDDLYALQNALRRGFIRFKTPDFPFHLYAGETTIDRTGTIQQRFLRGFTGGLDKVSQSRDIDWNSREIRIGVNSHLGPVEVDYSRTEKKFEARGADKVLSDVYALMTAPHDQVPDLKSGTDTVKLHTSYTGRVVGAVTYSNGDKKNLDSRAKADFRNAAGDLTVTPAAGLLLALKYRHYDLSQSNPDTVTLPGLAGPTSVRDAISSKRDVVTGAARYRVTPSLTVKGEYAFETTERTTGLAPDDWDVAHRTTKSTEKLGIAYRVLSRLSLKADVSSAQVENPAYAADPDRIDEGKATVTWTPVPQVVALASYGGVREQRDDLSAPLAGGSRKSDRDQVLGSLTFLAGRRSSITASYVYLNYKTAETLTFRDAAGLFNLEQGVPYGDKSQIFSLAVSQALTDRVMVLADASRSFSRGNFRISETVPNTTGIDSLSDLRVVEDIYTAGLELQFSKYAGSEVRYQYRHYDDRIDNTQDGRVNTALTTVYVKW